MEHRTGGRAPWAWQLEGRGGIHDSLPGKRAARSGLLPARAFASREADRRRDFRREVISAGAGWGGPGAKLADLLPGRFGPIYFPFRFIHLQGTESADRRPKGAGREPRIRMWGWPGALQRAQRSARPCTIYPPASGGPLVFSFVHPRLLAVGAEPFPLRNLS